MNNSSRQESSYLTKWWRNVDHITITYIIILIGIGYVLTLAASPSVAHRIGASQNMFIMKQVVFFIIAFFIMMIASSLSLKHIKIFALIGVVISIIATCITLVHGVEIKGARRWISMPFSSVQPSEFLKPFFAVTAGYFLSLKHITIWGKTLSFPGKILSLLTFSIILFLLQAQPDIGMLSVIMVVFATQLFINGLPIIFFIIIIGLMAGTFIFAYFTFNHVHSRVQRFLHSDVGDHYQIDMSLRAFGDGGLIGRGPGEGHIKDMLPDAHADFVFAVAGEEYGFLLCCFIIIIFVLLIIRVIRKLIHNDNPFIILSTCGLITGFGLQAFVNMGSSLHLLPTKGMTLPFISYGGSSAISIAITMGLILALTRDRVKPGIFNKKQPDNISISHNSRRKIR